MEEYRLGPVEARFADLIWQHEPLTSGELVKLCQQELDWKKSTTYTVLKSTVTAACSKTRTAWSRPGCPGRNLPHCRASGLWRRPLTAPFPRSSPPLPGGTSCLTRRPYSCSA